MKPLQLLNMGQSIRETKDQPHRYKMTARNALPTFGAVKNPPARPAMEKQTSTTMKTDTLEMTPAASVKTAPSGLARFPLGRWTFRRNPFQPHAVTASVQAVVQSELSLDAVKVVRNDLIDADLELVSQVKYPLPLLAREQPKPHAITRMWARLTSQLFGAEKV